MRGRWAVLVGVVACTGCLRDRAERPAEPHANVAEATNVAAVQAPAPTRSLLDAPEQSEEYGAVRWERNFERALASSESSGKPVFLLFTEVPGCSTVRGFGNGPLSHPLLVEAIEDEFVPVVVRNNVSGKERQILKAFGEPTWNNPVVRFIDSERVDLVPRYANGWTAAGLSRSMVAALDEAGRDVPAYLQNLSDELSARRQTTTFSMYCFWSGEVALSGLDGVVSTRPGFAAGREVVDVVWDSRKTTLKQILRAAAENDAASGVVARTEAERKVASKFFADVVTSTEKTRYSAKDDKYQIRNRRWGWVPMTPAQATQVNRASVRSGSPTDYLSPRQVAFARSDRRFDADDAKGLKVVNAR